QDSYQNLKTVFVRPPSLRTVNISTPAWIAHPIASASGPRDPSRREACCRRCHATQPLASDSETAISNVSNPGRRHRYAKASTDNPTTTRCVRVINPQTVRDVRKARASPTAKTIALIAANSPNCLSQLDGGVRNVAGSNDESNTSPRRT